MTPSLSDIEIQELSRAKKKVLIVAGEASGDLYGGELIREVKSISPDVIFYGVGGDGMREAGLLTITRSEDLTVVGLVEVIKHIRPIREALSALKDSMETIKPDLVILIDFPDFNFRVAKAAKKAGIPVFYYISPQVWAWRRGRIKTISKIVDKMVVIFPFEVEIYKDAGVGVEFLGHPLMDSIVKKERGLVAKAKGNPSIALLPGSRLSEINRHMPILKGAAGILKEKFPEASFTIPLAPTLTKEDIAPYLEDSEVRIDVKANAFHEVVKGADVALVSSGTATVETALLGTPMVVIYRLNTLTYLMARILVRVDYIAMVNLISGRLVVPELIQGDATPERVAYHAEEILKDDRLREKMKEDLALVRQSIGEPGAGRRVAERVVDFL